MDGSFLRLAAVNGYTSACDNSNLSLKGGQEDGLVNCHLRANNFVSR